jgi:serine/threonine-protein kinase HipA
MEADYLLGVTDFTRLGALRFRRVGEKVFLAPNEQGVPALLDLGR